MTLYRSKKMTPRNGLKLKALPVGRIGGGAKQKDASLVDQRENAEETIAEIYDGPVEYNVISTTGKGELLTRPELAMLETELRTGEYDLLICDDLGRLVRGVEAMRLCGIAVDHGTRVIAINDGIDTWDEGWEEDVISACRDHVGHNVHTSKRLKKKLMLRFKRKGQAVPLEIAGYYKPQPENDDESSCFDDWSIGETEEERDWIFETVHEAKTLLREHLNCSLVADFFNDVEFPVGKYARTSYGTVRW